MERCYQEEKEREGGWKMQHPKPEQLAGQRGSCCSGDGAVAGGIFCAGGRGGWSTLAWGSARMVVSLHVGRSPLFRAAGRLRCLRAPAAWGHRAGRGAGPGLRSAAHRPGGRRAGRTGCCDEAERFPRVSQGNAGCGEDRVLQGNKALCKRRNCGARNHRRPAGSDQLC